MTFVTAKDCGFNFESILKNTTLAKSYDAHTFQRLTIKVML